MFSFASSSSDEVAFASLHTSSTAVAQATGVEPVRAATVGGSFALLYLKRRNRELYENLETVRSHTAEAKQALERANLGLANLAYEKHHYAREIRRCREFRSAWTDLQVFGAGEALEGKDEHADMLATLARELEVRKSLAARLDELKARRSALNQTLTARRQHLTALASELQVLKKAAEPLALLLFPTASSSSSLLPDPLKRLFDALAGAPSTVFVLSVVGENTASPPFLGGDEEEGETFDTVRTTSQNKANYHVELRSVSEELPVVVRFVLFDTEVAVTVEPTERIASADAVLIAQAATSLAFPSGCDDPTAAVRLIELLNQILHGGIA